MMKRKEIFEKALKLTTEDRNKTHGDPWENMNHIATMWNAYLSDRETNSFVVKLSPVDVCHMMQMVKMSRALCGAYNPDDFEDNVGYGGLAGEMAHIMNKEDLDFQASVKIREIKNQKFSVSPSEDFDPEDKEDLKEFMKPARAISVGNAKFFDEESYAGPLRSMEDLIIPGFEDFNPIEALGLDPVCVALDEELQQNVSEKTNSSEPEYPAPESQPHEPELPKEDTYSCPSGTSIYNTGRHPQ